MFIMAYLLLGFLVLFAYSAVVEGTVHKTHVKSYLKQLLHGLVFIALWPLDIVWCLYRLISHPEDFKTNVND